MIKKITITTIILSSIIINVFSMGMDKYINILLKNPSIDFSMYNTSVVSNNIKFMRKVLQDSEYYFDLHLTKLMISTYKVKCYDAKKENRDYKILCKKNNTYQSIFFTNNEADIEYPSKENAEEDDPFGFYKDRYSFNNSYLKAKFINNKFYVKFFISKLANNFVVSKKITLDYDKKLICELSTKINNLEVLLKDKRNCREIDFTKFEAVKGLDAIGDMMDDLGDLDF